MSRAAAPHPSRGLSSGGALLRRPPPALLLLSSVVGRRRRPAAPPPRAAPSPAPGAAAAAAPPPPPPPPRPPRALEAAAQLAASRLAESRRPDALFNDPFAELLARADGQAGAAGGASDESVTTAGTLATTTATAAATTTATAAAAAALLDAVATRYLDECLLNAAAATSVTRMARGEDYRQVVLLGDGGDCRPFRLPWPEGTILFSVAPAEVHERAEALLQQQQVPPRQPDGGEASPPPPPPARVPRGCLLRRVDLDVSALRRAEAEADAPADDASAADAAPAAAAAAGSTLFLDALARAGFRGDRLSVWGLQGLQGLGLGRGALRALLAEVSSAAAFHSLVAGELPGPLTRREGGNLLAEAGLLASVEPPGGEGTRAYGRGAAAPVAGEGADDSGGGGRGAGEGGGEGEAASAAGGEDLRRWPRLLFSGQLMRPSLEQMGIYSDHVGAMEGSEEDLGTLHFD